jgi:hypothetical protein
LNFNSLLVEESVNTEEPAREDQFALFERPGRHGSQWNHKKTSRPVTDLGQRDAPLDNYGHTLTSDDLSLEEIVKRN